MTKLRIGFALGGGGARCMAHIGVIKVLQRNNIIPGLITGTSMGALIGGLYSIYGDAAAIEEKTKKVLESGAFKNLASAFFQGMGKGSNAAERVLLMLKSRYLSTIGMLRPYTFENSAIYGILETLFGDSTIESAKIPFAAVAVDIVTGKKIVFEKGLFRDALLPSMAIPAIFPPIKAGGRVLVDGGVLEMVPVETALALGADFVVASSVNGEIRRRESFSTGYDIITRVNTIGGNALNLLSSRNADITIRPGVGDAHWANFDRAGYLVSQGEQAAAGDIGKIKSKLWRNRIKYFFGLKTKRCATGGW